MFTMLKTRNVPGVGEFLKGEDYPDSPLMKQFERQGFAEKKAKTAKAKKAPTTAAGSDDQ